MMLTVNVGAKSATPSILKKVLLGAVKGMPLIKSEGLEAYAKTRIVRYDERRVSPKIRLSTVQKILIIILRIRVNSRRFRSVGAPRGAGASRRRFKRCVGRYGPTRDIRYGDLSTLTKYTGSC